jgi:flagellar assembly protein FliH
MNAARPYAFDRIFPACPSATPIGAQALSAQVERLKEELDTVRNTAKATSDAAQLAGRAAALTELRAERDTALLAALDALGGALERIEAGFADTQAGIAREAAEVALAAADHLAGRALGLDPSLAVDQAIGRALEHMQRGTPVTVRVHPELAPMLETRLASRQASERRKLSLTVLSDQALALGDARLDWDGGALAVDANARRAAIRAELEALFA